MEPEQTLYQMPVFILWSQYWLDTKTRQSKKENYQQIFLMNIAANFLAKY